MTVLLPSEEYLRQRFEARWSTLEKKSLKRGLSLPNKEALYSKILTSYKNQFRCEYCGQLLLICDHTPPHFKSFSIDHRTSLDAGGDNSLENFAIICTRCNIIKGTMTEETYRAFLKPLLSNPQLLDRIFSEMWNGRFANKLEREQKPSDSTLPGCIGMFGKPIYPNGPCDRCRDKKFCEKSADFGVDVAVWFNPNSNYYPIISKNWPSCFGKGSPNDRYSDKKCVGCPKNDACGFIDRT